jgi:hypothetical protein
MAARCTSYSVKLPRHGRVLIEICMKDTWIKLWPECFDNFKRFKVVPVKIMDITRHIGLMNSRHWFTS